MAFKRRYGKKKRATRRGRKLVKRFPRRQMIATPKMVYKIKLNAAPLTFTVPMGTDANYEFAPSLSNIPSAELTAFQELYDEFKITGYTWILMPRGNVAFTQNSNNAQGFNYYSILDYTDLQAISVSEAYEYSNMKRHVSWKTAKRYVPSMVPYLSYDINNNPLLTVNKPQWLQLAPQLIAGTNYNNTQIANIGCKITTEVNNTNSDVIFDLRIILHVSFKNKK